MKVLAEQTADQEAHETFDYKGDRIRVHRAGRPVKGLKL